MSIRENIEKQYKKSILEKNSDLTNTLRLIKSAIKDRDIEARTSGNNDGINDNQIMSLFQNLVKQRKDSIESFNKAERHDLVQKEEKELEIINSFLPKQKNEEETKNIISQLVKDNNLKSLKDMGNLMSILKENFSGEVDMSLAGKIAKTILTN